MKPKQFSIRFALVAMVMCAFVLWAAMPSSEIVITIAPDNSLLLDGAAFESEVLFWEALGERVDSCRAWNRKPHALIRVSQSLGHVPPLWVIMSMGNLGIEKPVVQFIDFETGELAEDVE